ncbi:MAG: HEAT repeat domain-containing protein [Candidatus Sumerlaeota bacterium]|nr:HEAT repeat domain-containing protein [Candidatus Sumerlaeota bacterium]
MNTKHNVACAFLGAIAMAMLTAYSAQAQQSDDVFAAIQKYEYDQSRTAMAALEDSLRGAPPEKMKETEGKLIQILQNPGATAAGKDYCCRLLRLIGTEKCVPALAALLSDEKLSHMARFALQGNPSPAAGEALRKALPTVSDKLKPGVISTLSFRRDKEAVSEIAKLVGSKNPDVANAALSALGRIGGTDAAKALTAAQVPDAMKAQKLDNMLLVADAMLADGKAGEAAAVYREISAEGNPTQNRIAAYRGLILSEKDKAAQTIVMLLKNKDLKLQQAGGKFISDAPEGAETVKAIVSELPSLAPTAQTVVISALAQRGDKTAQPAVTQMVKSADPAVKIAALQALIPLGDASSVDAVAEALAAGGDAAKAAQETLERLKGDGVEAAMAKRVEAAGAPEIRTGLMVALGNRGAKGVSASLIKAAGDSDAKVRDEALKTLATLASENDIEPLIGLVKKAQQDKERRGLEKALITACRRVKDESQRVDKVLAAMSGAGAARASLMRVLGPVGGAKALSALKDAMQDSDAAMVDAAVRSLCDATDPAAADLLADVAKNAKDKTHRILALRALVALGAREEFPQDKRLSLMEKAFAAAQSAEDKKTVIAAAADTKDLTTLEFLEKRFDDPDAGADAQNAYKRIFTDAFKKKNGGDPRMKHAQQVFSKLDAGAKPPAKNAK